jgi:hypothetical protein
MRAQVPGLRINVGVGVHRSHPVGRLAAFQVLPGNIIDQAGRAGELNSPSGFKSAFSVCLAGALVGLVLSFLIKGKPITSG